MTTLSADPAFDGLTDPPAQAVEKAEAAGRISVVDLDRGITAISLSAQDRQQSVHDLTIPDFTLPDFDGVEHRFSDWNGTRRLLLAWSSW